ncbi:NUDIX hydrolase [Streptosporangiaceae bacterium NEAU-GS5]|nr:NUDIX hydrolase [Streptosporangiaceae bacterium NEAU-GS5]
MTVREDQIERANGTSGIYGYVDKPDFVLVVPMEGDGFHLVEEYRYPIGRRSWSFPQGNATAETPELEARMELAEETGFRAGDMRHLGYLDNSHGVITQGFHVYLASDLRPGDHAREDTEQDMVQRWVSRAEFEQMIRDGQVTDSCSVAAYLLLLMSERPGLQPAVK